MNSISPSLLSVFFKVSFLMVLTLAQSACGTGAKTPQTIDLPKKTLIYLAPVKNLSGVPLSRLDPDIYTADNLEHASKLSGGNTLSMPALTREAIAVALRDEGFVVSENPKTPLHFVVSISEWSGASIPEDGRIWFGLDGFFIDRHKAGSQPLASNSKRFHQLLSGEPDEAGVLGTMRLVGGSYQRVALDAALDLLINAGLLKPEEASETGQ